MRAPANRLIINADDFGLTQGVSRAIMELLGRDAVSNTTAMMCADGSPDLQSSLRTQFDTRRVGLHLQLTGGAPLLRGGRQVYIDDESGRFRGRDFVMEADPEAVYLEWRAQLGLFQRIYGHKPSHIDTHHGVHRVPQLLPVYVRLAQEIGIPARAGENITNRALSASGVEHADLVLSDWTGTCGSAPDLVTDVQRNVKRYCGDDRRVLVEIVTHPGFNDPDLERKSSLNSERVHEFNVLSAMGPDFWRRHGYRIHPFATAAS